ncbi:MAG: chromosomal replication initiator protein DnaA [Erysipelotrichaceae bacterium]|nr:chromosomal replication initiator protein DnaA [Erysipelotrichaceae bacterium]MDY5727566.1 chromosomal replication initiator protein DnaA [Erysipelotrichaceae bacterium]
MDALNILYQKIKEIINEKLIENKHKDLINYFVDTQLVKLEENNAVITTPFEITKLVLTSNSDIVKIINDTFSDFFKRDYKCSIITTNDYLKENSEMIEKELNDNLMSDFTFENFVEGPSNREAKTAALACAIKPGQKAYNPLFIYGDSGLGKTHLLNAIGNYIKENNSEMKVLYISSMTFVNDAVKAIKEKTIDEYKNQLNSLDVLLFDDIQNLSNKPQSKDIFFNIYNELFNNRKQVVLTSDRSPSQIKDVEDRLKTRFSQGLSVTINSLEYETAFEILKMKLKSHGINDNSIDDDVLSFIATNFSSDVRNLEGAINRLLFYSINFFNTQKIDLNVALEAFKDQKTTLLSKNDNLDVRNIIKAVADYYGLTEKQIKSKSRTKNIATARHISMYLSRKLLDLSYDKIGEEFGGKDHSTVLSAYEKIDKLVRENEIYKKIVDDIRKNII